ETTGQWDVFAGTQGTGQVYKLNTGNYYDELAEERYLTFGTYNVPVDANPAKEAAQSFKMSQYNTSQTVSLTKALLYMKKVAGTTTNLQVRIETDNNGVPSGAAVTGGTATLSAFTSTSYAWKQVEFSSTPELTGNTTYWLVVKHITEGTGDSQYAWLGDTCTSTYVNGHLATYQNTSQTIGFVQSEELGSGEFDVNGLEPTLHNVESGNLIVVSAGASTLARQVDQQQLVSDTNWSYTWGDNGGGNNRSQVGQFFRAGSTQTLKSCRFWLAKNIDNPGDSVRAEIYSATLSAGVFTVGSLLETSSNSILGSILPLSIPQQAFNTIHEFNFSGTSLTEGQYYFIAIKRDTLGNDDYIIGASQANTYTNGGFATKTGGTQIWGTSTPSSVDLAFRTYYQYTASLPLVESVTDSNENTYYQAVASTISDGNIANEIWYAYNVIGGNVDVAVTFTAAMRANVILQEFSGALTTDPLDKTAVAVSADGSSGALSVGPTAVTSTDSQIVVAFAQTNKPANEGALTVGTGYSNLVTTPDSSVQSGAESKVITVAAAQTATMTDAANVYYAFLLATFKSVSTGTNWVADPLTDQAFSLYAQSAIEATAETALFAPAGLGKEYKLQRFFTQFNTTGDYGVLVGFDSGEFDTAQNFAVSLSNSSIADTWGGGGLWGGGLLWGGLQARNFTWTTVHGFVGRLMRMTISNKAANQPWKFDGATVSLTRRLRQA
ncbi:MAG: hypothetical protein NUV80_04425, partial [Candidatus Berkelbacteria bacterium]|nr:hypothetical protein [Candidatus Berkelbacteria bacterium]